MRNWSGGPGREESEGRRGSGGEGAGPPGAVTCSNGVLDSAVSFVCSMK